MQRRVSACALLAFAGFWTVTGLRAPAQSFTLEQVLTSPFPEQLTAAEHGSHIAWVFADRGAQNVYAADGRS